MYDRDTNRATLAILGSMLSKLDKLDDDDDKKKQEEQEENHEDCVKLLTDMARCGALRKYGTYNNAISNSSYLLCKWTGDEMREIMKCSSHFPKEEIF